MNRQSATNSISFQKITGNENILSNIVKHLDHIDCMELMEHSEEIKETLDDLSVDQGTFSLPKHYFDDKKLSVNGRYYWSRDLNKEDEQEQIVIYPRPYFGDEMEDNNDSVEGLQYETFHNLAMKQADCSLLVVVQTKLKNNRGYHLWKFFMTIRDYEVDKIILCSIHQPDPIDISEIVESGDYDRHQVKVYRKFYGPAQKKICRTIDNWEKGTINVYYYSNHEGDVYSNEILYFITQNKRPIKYYAISNKNILYELYTIKDNYFKDLKFVFQMFYSTRVHFTGIVELCMYMKIIKAMKSLREIYFTLRYSHDGNGDVITEARFDDINLDKKTVRNDKNWDNLHSLNMLEKASISYDDHYSVLRPNHEFDRDIYFHRILISLPSKLKELHLIGFNTISRQLITDINTMFPNLELLELSNPTNVTISCISQLNKLKYYISDNVPPVKLPKNLVAFSFRGRIESDVEKEMYNEWMRNHPNFNKRYINRDYGDREIVFKTYTDFHKLLYMNMEYIPPREYDVAIYNERDRMYWEYSSDSECEDSDEDEEEEEVKASGVVIENVEDLEGEQEYEMDTEDVDEFEEEEEEEDEEEYEMDVDDVEDEEESEEESEDEY